MCGRGRLCLSLEQIKETGRVKSDSQCPNELKPTVNFSPGNASPVVISRLSDETREVHMMLFGLIPHFTTKKEKPNHYIMFNARIETLMEKPSFRNLVVKGKRCIVFLNGFYEWRTENKVKQPYYVYLDSKNASDSSDSNSNTSSSCRDDNLSAVNKIIEENDPEKEKMKLFQTSNLNSKSMGITPNVPDNHNPKIQPGQSINDTIMIMAGLYDEWEDSNGQVKRTYTTLTCASCTGFRWLHSRQPVFLTDKYIDAWLSPKSDILALLSEFDSAEYKERYSPLFMAYPVTRKMGVASYQEDDCHHCIELKNDTKQVKAISNYFSSSDKLKIAKDLEEGKIAVEPVGKMVLDLKNENVDNEIEVNTTMEMKNDRKEFHSYKNDYADSYYGNNNSYDEEIDEMVKIEIVRNEVFALDDEKLMTMVKDTIKAEEKDQMRGKEKEENEENKAELNRPHNYDLAMSGSPWRKRKIDEIEGGEGVKESENEDGKEEEEEENVERKERKENDDLFSVAVAIDEDIFCPICSLDVTSLTQINRNNHVNICCNNMDSSTTNHSDCDINKIHDKKSNIIINKSNIDNNSKSPQKSNLKKTPKKGSKSNEMKNKMSSATKEGMRGSIQNYFLTSRKNE